MLLPDYCYSCGAYLQGGATKHKPDCEIQRMIDEYCRKQCWLMQCMICGKVDINLVAMQEHAMEVHGYSQEDHRNATKRERKQGYIWTMPDGRDWMCAVRVPE